MKQTKSASFFLMALLAAVLITVAGGCGSGGGVTPEVLSVSVNPAAAEVEKGGTRQFTAEVEAAGGAPETVSWSIDETGRALGTSINDSGLLSVDAAESLETLTVRAASSAPGFTGISGTAGVTVKEPGQNSLEGSLSVTLSVKDEALVLGGFPSAVPVIYKTGTGAWTANDAGNPKILSITVSNAGAFSLSWLVDGGSAGSSQTVAVDAGDYSSGGHWISLLAEDGEGVTWSAGKAFTVRDNKEVQP